MIHLSPNTSIRHCFLILQSYFRICSLPFFRRLLLTFSFLLHAALIYMPIYAQRHLRYAACLITTLLIEPCRYLLRAMPRYAIDAERMPFAISYIYAYAFAALMP